MALKYWKFSTRVDAAERAESIMKRMEDAGLADTLSYTQFMAILVGKDKRYSPRQVAERVQNIGNNMLQCHLGGNRLVKPSTQTWNTIINAWVQCGRPDKAEELLQRMENEFHHDKDMAPNEVTYSTVIDGWVKSGQNDTINHVEALYERLKQLTTNSSQYKIRLNHRTHAAMIRAYTKQGTVEAIEKAEDLFHDMYREYESGNVDMKPNTIALTTILEAWGVIGTKYGVERAEALLDFAITANKDRNDPTLCPNEICFSCKYNHQVLIFYTQMDHVPLETDTGTCRYC
jgi:pentatricopeptide repeat protein